MNKLTVKQRAVLEDVLKVIRKPNITVKPGTYLRVVDRFGVDSRSFRALKALQKFGAQKAPLHSDLFRDSKASECLVCARGALFLATVDRYNSVNVDEALRDFGSGLEDRVSLFTEPQLEFFEWVFEIWAPSDLHQSEPAEAQGSQDQACLAGLKGAERLAEHIKMVLERGYVSP